MKEQNFENHSRFVPGYHYVTLTAILLLLIGSFVNLFRSAKENLYSASLICLIAFILVLVSWYLRSFALKAQDRAIRAEENFRHFILTGKPLPAELKMGQIIALRFASDEEYVALISRAIAEKLSNKNIKQAIQQWRADHHRA
jgi:ammonia channel protein AmtB